MYNYFIHNLIKSLFMYIISNLEYICDNPCKILFINLIILICSGSYLNSITLVYNMRVRRAFNVPEQLQGKKPRWVSSAVPILFLRNSNITNELTRANLYEERKAGGALLDLRYIPSRNWWIDASTAIERDSADFVGTECFSGGRTGFDDLVFTGGYRHFTDKNKVQLALYGLVGIPTRRKVDLSERYGTFVGSRFYNLGIGAESSYSFINKLKRSAAVIMQGRFVHAFNRSWYPILPIDTILQPGNFSDLLCLIQFREKRTVFEAGYDMTIFSNQAIISPRQIIRNNTFVRNSGYVSVSHIILKGLFNNPLAFGGGINGSTSKEFNSKTFSVWGHVTLVF